MNVAVIGCGNMGGAIARGLAGKDAKVQVLVTSHDGRTARALAAEEPALRAVSNNAEAVHEADVIVIAVKPWLVKDVLDDVQDELTGKPVLSVAAGVEDPRIAVYVMPNIAAQYAQSMTFIQLAADVEAVRTAIDLFGRLGRTVVVEPRQMQAGMMLAGCGIAYVMRFVRAMQQAGVEMGFRPSAARDVAIQTLMGAGAVLTETGLHPEEAIDRVTTPGGYTIKGLNELDHAGFTSAVIRAMKAGLKKD